ncbi:MAG: TRAP transporter small permease [Rhizobiaceae bacterium]|nr:TRAP transporter small permease [Rhizobiaceae bacterium]
MTDPDPKPEAPSLPGASLPGGRNLLDLTSYGMMVISCLALLAMTVIVSYEVASRYFLHAPTTWAWDINIQLMMLMTMFGLAEVYRRDDYVRVDVITSLLSPRARTVLDIVFAPVMLFVAAVIVWMSWKYFHQSWVRNQHASTIFGPPLWPIKATIPIGAAVLFAHGVLKLVRDIRLLRGPAPVSRA